MKATIEIPNELYRRVKAKSALEGRPVRAVVVELFGDWIGEPPPTATRRKPARSRAKPTPPWFGLARRYARKVKDHSMEAIRESIEKGWAREIAEKEARLRKGSKR